MRNFLVRLLFAPFKFLFWLISLPFIGLWRILLFLPPVKKFQRFMTEVPTDRSVGEALSDTVNHLEGFFEHIEAIRGHLLRILVVFLISSGVALNFAPRLMEFLSSPVGGLQNLNAFQMTESVGVYMSVSVNTALIFIAPYIAFEVWLFMAPGLMPRARQFGLASIPLALILFVCGVVFTYFIILKPAAEILWNFVPGISQLQSAKDYFTFVNRLMLIMGIGFEYPLIIYALTSLGFVKPKVLWEQSRLAIVIITVLAAMITPTVDPINMFLVMGPMVVLYFIGIFFSNIALAARNETIKALLR